MMIDLRCFFFGDCILIKTKKSSLFNNEQRSKVSLRGAIATKQSKARKNREIALQRLHSQ
jgi:hypothetical protein